MFQFLLFNLRNCGCHDSTFYFYEKHSQIVGEMKLMKVEVRGEITFSLSFIVLSQSWKNMLLEVRHSGCHTVFLCIHFFPHLFSKHDLVVHFFSSVNNVSIVPVCWPIHPLKAILLAFMLWQSWINPLQTCTRRFLCRCNFSIYLRNYRRSWLLDHMVGVCLVL